MQVSPVEQSLFSTQVSLHDAGGVDVAVGVGVLVAVGVLLGSWAFMVKNVRSQGIHPSGVVSCACDCSGAVGAIGFVFER